MGQTPVGSRLFNTTGTGLSVQDPPQIYKQIDSEAEMHFSIFKPFFHEVMEEINL